MTFDEEVRRYVREWVLMRVAPPAQRASCLGWWRFGVILQRRYVRREEVHRIIEEELTAIQEMIEQRNEVAA